MELTRKLSTVLAPTAYLAKWKSKALVSVAVDPLASDEAERGLKFGDCISLFSAEHNGYMSTDGYVNEVGKPGAVGKKLLWSLFTLLIC